jgi:hypothetical protein
MTRCTKTAPHLCTVSQHRERNPFAFLSRDPDDATPAQKVIGVLLLLALFVVAGMDWR